MGYHDASETMMKAIFQHRYGPPEALQPTDIDTPAVGALKELVDAETRTPVVDRTYPLSETAAAIGYLEQGHARGKVVITV